MDLTMALVMLPGLVVGLSVHECAHAWSASLLGDDLARRQGRVSLNPFRHLSLLGTLAIFVLPIGWAKPVPVNLYNFKRPKRDYLITSLAGPAANMLMVMVCIALMHLTRRSYRFGDAGGAMAELVHVLLSLTAIINTILAVINLLPIPPLDGSKIWPCLLPGVKPSFKPKTTMISIVILIVLMQTHAFEPMFNTVVGGLAKIMPESDYGRFETRCDSAIVAMAEDKYELAETLLTDALAIHPGSHDAISQRSVARFYLGKLEPALDDMNNAIAIEDGFAAYYMWRAAVLDELGRGAEAEADRLRMEQLGMTISLETQPTTQPAFDSPQPQATAAP